MCCLFGLLDYDHALPGRQKERVISVLSRECETRGKDATGISTISGGHISIYKRPLPAHKMHIRVSDDCRVIMGHTRLATQGDEHLNYNNHPFSGRTSDCGFAMAHNGILYNDRTLRISFSLPATKIQTDSYVIAQLIEKQNVVSFTSLEKVAEQLEGSFTFTVMTSKGELFFVKGDNPICIYHFDGCYIYASTEEILKSALIKLSMLQRPHSKLTVSCGDIVRIAPSGTATCSKFDTSSIDAFDCCRHIPYSFEYDILDSEDSQYRNDLIDCARCRGILPSEVETLIRYGFDYATIEELVYEPELLYECLSEAMFDSIV